ncbi:helix-turn-helix domain-containing protein [Cellulophaga algicola]|uniref:helix-turn-helix domain-containing protein n=1 Tax=Cellulophaga algicola TaxID=59600 RepID=UPI00030DDC4A
MAYKLISRFENRGYEGLKEQSRAPGKHPNATNENIVDSIVKLKKKYKLWGAKKSRAILFKELLSQEVPSVVMFIIFLKETVFYVLKKG